MNADPLTDAVIKALLDSKGITFGDCTRIFAAPKDHWAIPLASEFVEDGQWELDDPTVISEGAPDGCYVMFWRWVDDPKHDEEDES